MTRMHLIAAVLLFCVASPSVYATDLVAKKIVYSSAPRLGRTMRLGCEVANTNALIAAQFLVRFTIQRGTSTVFDAWVTGVNLKPDSSLTLWTDIMYTPPAAGGYITRAEIVFGDEIDPSDNTIATTFSPLPAFISIAQAVARLQVDVINDLPEKNTLSAYHVRGRQEPPDSVHNEGTTIGLRDGTTSLLAAPSYVFFVDRSPMDLWGHPAMVVQIPAEQGASTATTTHHTDFVVSVDGEEPLLGPDCSPNPQLVLGIPPNCFAAPNITMVATQNDTDCVLIITGRVVKEHDGTTIEHDLPKVIERLNSGALGPKVSSSNIMVVRGKNDFGATPADVKAAFAALKEKKCARIYIKYIGHGLVQGLCLQDPNKNTTDLLTWEEWASLIKDLDCVNLTVDITSCHSGQVIPALETAGVRGRVITSSNGNNTTPQGRGSGTYWEEALLTASRDTAADLNKDGTVDVIEAALYVKATKPATDDAMRPQPQVKELVDLSLPLTSYIDATIVDAKTIESGGGPIEVRQERFCVRTTYKSGSTRKDDTICRRNIYVVNSSGSARNATHQYEIVAVCGSGRKKTQVVLATVQPQLSMRQRVLVCTVPDTCQSIFVRKVAPPRLPTVLLDSGKVIARQYATIVNQDGNTFRVPYTIADPDQGAFYSASTTGPAEYLVGNEPHRFASQPDRPAQIHVYGSIPQDSAGADVLTTVVNDTTFAITQLHTRVLTPLVVSGSAPVPSTNHRDVLITNGTSTIERLTKSMVQLAPSSGLIGSDSALSLSDVVIRSDDTTAPAFETSADSNAITYLNNVVLSGLSYIVVSSSVTIIRNLVIGGAPLTITDAWGTDQFDFISSFGARGDAVTIHHTLNDNVNFYGLVVDGADGFDLVQRGLGELRCTDCLIDITKTAARFGSVITQLQNISAVVTTKDGEPVEADTVHVVSSDGTLLATTTTDANGVATFAPVVIGSMSDVVFLHTPISVRLIQQSGVARTVTLPHTGWSQVFFEDTSATTHVHSDQTILSSTISPMPLERSSLATVQDQRGITHISIYGVEGSLINTLTGNGATHVSLPVSTLAPGWYIVLVHRSDGADRIPVIVH
ncbi:MAG: hypothetical protein IPI29_02900 [Ignavibacteria bacterium]|nr:hypothetical protein [Ignavibacteria bacterium]